MSDNHQLAFVAPHSLATSTTTLPPTTEQFDHQFFSTTSMTTPEIPSYGVDYNQFFVADGGLQTNLNTEQYFDRQDCMTPLSQHSFVDHSSNASDAPAASPLRATIDLPTTLSAASPAAFMTPAWTPEPMARFEDHASLSTPVASPRPMHRYSHSNASTVGFSAPPVRVFAHIAPNPATPGPKRSLKRSMSRDEDAMAAASPPKRKRSASPSTSAAELNAEDELLLRLKDEEGLSWKEIQSRFQTDLNKMFQVPALQMRLKRLRERMREWTETDVQALRLAHEYWNDNKFDIIAAKMAEFGANEKWSSKQCFKKWHEIAPQPDYFRPQQFQSTPTFTPMPFPSTYVSGTPEMYHSFVTTSA